MTKNGKIDPERWAKSFAVWSAILMIILWILGNLGVYMGAVEAMQNWHIFFSLSFAGLIGGVIEASVVSYLLVHLFAWIHNKF